MSGPTIRRPANAIVERIFREEARRAGVAFAAALGSDKRRKAVSARRAAVARIINETGCSRRGAADAWGVDKSLVDKAMTPIERTARKPTLDDQTRERLSWAHGPARAAQIARGECPQTQADLAAWRRVIAHGEPQP